MKELLSEWRKYIAEASFSGNQGDRQEEVVEAILKEFSASDIDMEDLALVYDEEYGPDYVAGMLASEFPALDTDAAYEKLLGMLKEAARRGEKDYPLNFLAKRIAELAR